MKLIIGLGNPGKSYEHTRHNAGFLCIDFLRDALCDAPLTRDTKMSAEIGSTTLFHEKILFAKPLTYMNASGEAVLKLLSFYKLTSSDIIVLHDDIDIPLGTYKITSSSRAAGHNGVQDIIDKIGSQHFYRIRLGVGRPKETPDTCLPIHDFVLQDFSNDEYTTLSALFPTIKEEVLRLINP
ncbi:MAG: aminoacyl-tRNA hydrolase [Candidatus Moranbacteria bacterium]|nr:aminoacyl-tRNA hydrolase [Candidatus Moranbacteria bacterium]